MAAHIQGLGQGFGDTTQGWKGVCPLLPSLCLAGRLEWLTQCEQVSYRFMWEGQLEDVGWQH